MTPQELVGQVGHRLILDLINDARSRSGGSESLETARIVLDMLEPEHVGAIVRAIAGDPDLSTNVYVQIKSRIATLAGLPETFHTDKTEVWFRNHEPPQGQLALLIATDGDDQRESLEELARISAADLRNAADTWVALVSRGGLLLQKDQAVWSKALQGLADAREESLQQFARYISATRDRIHGEGETLLAALGQALPQLRLPCDVGAFVSIKEKQQTQKGAWRKRFLALFADRWPLLTKHLKTGQLIDASDLNRQLRQLLDDGLLGPQHVTVFDAFIAAPPQWCDEAQALAELEWDTDHVSDFFTGIRQKQKGNLATVTLTHFSDEGLPLSRGDEEYLKALQAKKSFKQSDDPADRDFYDRHVTDLAKNPKLKSKWDIFVFGSAVTCTDLLEGLIEAMARLCARVDDWSIPRELDIKIHGRGDRYFRELNADLAQLFCLRYRGLAALFGTRINFDIGPLTDYDKFLSDQRERGHKRSTSTSRAATTIRLDLKLRSDAGDHVVQLLWSGSPFAVSVNLAEDLKRLHEDPLLILKVERNRVSRKGEAQNVSLSNYMSFDPVYGQEAGTMVPREDSRVRWRAAWSDALSKAVERAAISAAVADHARDCFVRFESEYRSALEAFAAGAVGEPMLKQAETYGELLHALAPVMIAEMDVPRRDLVEPVLALGVVQIADRIPSAVVTPWHPLRLAATAVKTHRVTTFINHVIGASSVDFGDLGLFFRDFREQLRHPHYPEAIIGYRGESPVLLVVTDTVDEYSLAEEPHPEDAEWRSDSDPSDAAARVKDIVQRYLELQPHEQANLSVALYNCESAGLPIAAIDALSDLQETDVHCHVVLRHENVAVLRRVYTELLEHADADPDALVASETSKNFMANLRVGIQLEAPATLSPRDARAADIAFMDDVVSRRASVKMLPAPNETSPPALLTHVPGHWSYRLPVGSEQTRASRFLTCPEQPSCCLEQLRATLAVVEPIAGKIPYRLPVRELAFGDLKTGTLLKDVHNLAEWVVNHDDLLEPDQLRNLGVQVIRYRRDATRGRNLIVSSTSQSGLLLTLVQRRLQALNLGLSDTDLRQLAELLVHDATKISGEIALRATKRGEFAGELIGIVLSHALVRDELGAASAQAWYFLDDYASWLGQREGGIADLIVLSPQNVDGKLALRIRVTEAKYVVDSLVLDMRKRSRAQLQNTVDRIRSALFGNPGRLDRDLWLSRLSEFLVQASHAAAAMQTFTGLQRAVRDGTALIDLRGYSHLFVSGPLGSSLASAREELPVECGSHALQETFSVDAVRDLLLRYFRRQPLLPARELIVPGERPWESPAFATPAPRPTWAHVRVRGSSPTPTRTEATDDEARDARLVSTARAPTPEDVTTAAVQSGNQASSRRSDVAVSSAQIPTSTDEPTDAPASYKGKPIAGNSETFAMLLARHVHVEGAPADTAWLDDTVLKLRQALTRYGLQAQVLGRRLTPNAALVRLQGTDRLHLKDIETRRPQLLTSHGLSVINVAARPNEIIVSIARPERETVSLWDVWGHEPPKRSDLEPDLCLLIGLREVDGEPFYLNLGDPRGNIPTHAPHTLVAGTTGSGKSVLIQNLLIDLAVRNSPRRVRIHIIDPKQGVDYFSLEGLPHIEGGLIVEQGRALELLDELVAEMDRRYTLFREERVNKLAAYNTKVGPERALPVLFVVHDEFAEWMLTDTYRDSVTSVVSRLSVKARAAGIHLLFAAQRPDSTVMPMQLRDNLGNRLVLRVEGEGTSEIALGVKGAERLLGRGHVVARLSGEPDLIFGQVPYLPVEDIASVVDSLTPGGL
jgi:S-DNA-T family DNA segregation ATPase FtsK/SpoIIIE